MGTSRFSRTLTVGFVALAAAAATVLAAPAAQAATTTSCTLGLIISYGPSYISVGSNCPGGFVDHGAPYVFDVATVEYVVYYPGTSQTFHNVVATCTGTDVNPTAGLQGNGCTYSGL